MSSIDFAPEEDRAHFITLARTSFIDLANANHMFGCFDNTITRILNTAKAVLANAGDTSIEERVESLTEQQATLYEYILQRRQ